MRFRPAGAACAAAAMLVSASAAAAPAHARPTAVIAFLPPSGTESRPLLDELAARGMAIGLVSPAVGGFEPRQAALDMTQGARIPQRLYDGEIGGLRLRDGRLSGWTRTRERALEAPGDLRPGLLAATIERAGGRVGYGAVAAGPGARGSFAPGAVVAADEQGRVERAARAWADALTVVGLPRGAAGLRALDELLARRPRDGFLFALRAPYGDELRLLPAGVAAPGIGGRLRSDTTRRDGMIAATDVAPSVLRFLGIGVPEAMEGESIEGRGDADAAAVRGLGDRLAVVTSRRGDALIWLAASWSLVLVLLRAAGGAAGGRAALRIGLLGVLWLPGLALLTSALAPARLTEVAILGLGSVALGAATDRALRWPLAPALPASVVFVAHAIDLAAGSPLIAGSLAGSNPAGGARFFGIGNELEALLSVSVLIGAGGALSGAATGGSRAAVAIAGAAGSAALVMGAGRLGADVGAVITLGAGGAAAFVTALPGPVTRRRIAVAIAAPAAALVALIAIDLASGGGAHLTRSVLEANGSGDLVDVATRRIESSVANLGKPGWAIATALALVAVVWLALWRERFLAVVPRPFAAGLVGAWFAVVVGALANDSGPLILDLGAVLLLLGAAYARARPVEPRRPGIAARLHGCA